MNGEMTRRGFLELSGAAGLSALGGETAEQLTAEVDTDDVAAYGLLLGPESARPSKGGQYLSQWDTYSYAYFATDSGEQSYTTHTDDSWHTLPMSLTKYETGFGFPAVRNSTNRLDVPAAYDFNTDRHRLVVNGTVIQNLANTSKFADLDGKWQIQASGGDTIEFGVRELTRYVPNYELLWGCASWAESSLSSGQTVFVEFTDDARENGYRYRFEPDQWYVEQLSQGTVVSRKERGNWESDPRNAGMALTDPFVCRDFLSWYGAGNSRFTFSFPNDDDKMRNDTVATTSNQDDIATRAINNRVKVVVDMAVGAGSLTWNIGSFGTLIQGQATQFDREKIGTHWDLGGSISQYPTDNEPVLALRIDPNRANTAVQIPTPVFAPTSETMEMTVYGVLESDTDADFLDVDGDGTDEGPFYAAQTQAQNNVLQVTRNVSTFPTTSGRRADDTAGEVVDARQIASAVATGSGNKNDPPVPSSGGAVSVKRPLYPGEVALFIPRTDPASSTTSGSIEFIQDFSEQDW